MDNTKAKKAARPKKQAATTKAENSAQSPSQSESNTFRPKRRIEISAEDMRQLLWR